MCRNSIFCRKSGKTAGLRHKDSFKGEKGSMEMSVFFRYSYLMITGPRGKKGKNTGSTISVGRRRNRRGGGFVYRLRTLSSNSRSVSCPWQTTGRMSRKVRLAGVFPVSVSGSSGSSCSISCRSPGSLHYSQRQVCCLIQTW